jgi:hypothetical protein
MKHMDLLHAFIYSFILVGGAVSIAELLYTGIRKFLDRHRQLCAARRLARAMRVARLVEPVADERSSIEVFRREIAR